jgi:hypothetical protein
MTVNLTDLTDRIELQNREFNALEKLIEKYKIMCKVAVVDDDYPEVRHYYESALKDFLDALRNNGRLDHASPSQPSSSFIVASPK